jgi:hydrogenase-4 component F
MLIWVVLIPAGLGLLAVVVPGRTLRRAMLGVGSAGHAGLLVPIAVHRQPMQAGAWIGLDPAGLLFLSITSILFMAVSIYTLGYLDRESGRNVRDAEEGFLIANEPEAIFIGCLLLFLATMSLVCISRDLGLLWVAVEATTLVSAPLISYHRHHRSLEATWKYLLICSVGIALALLGNFFLAFAGRAGHAPLHMDSLIAGAAGLDPVWLKASFLMFLVGYGTKMGLVPMHTWLPDAHSEAPSMVSALLSGALLNCAFLGILRSHAVLSAAGLGSFSGGLLVFFGLLSMATAAVFLIRQGDYKRMLAYSSIEHMGILSLGIGLGGLAGAGAMLHALNHSLTKGLLFLTAGQLLYSYGTKSAGEVAHALKRTPLTGFLWLAGFFAIAGSPPFGLFVSELTILKGALDAGRWGVGAFFLLALAVIFIAMARTVLPMVFGDPLKAPGAVPDHLPAPAEPSWFTGPVLVMGLCILILGLYLPSFVWRLASDAAVFAGGVR